MKKSILYLSALALILTACNGETQSDSSEASENAVKTCSYSYDATTTKLEWTAYKTTDKVAVKGTFNDLNIMGTTSSENPLNVLRNAKFEIPVATVNSKNPERDKKISANFFGSMTSTAVITGEIKFLDNMKVRMNVTLNGVTREVEGVFSMTDAGYFTLDASLNLANFNAENAVKSLNTVCGDLHKGPDGVSKLWNEVALHFETGLKKTCE